MHSSMTKSYNPLQKGKEATTNVARHLHHVSTR